jgi:hypothetical protein
MALTQINSKHQKSENPRFSLKLTPMNIGEFNWNRDWLQGNRIPASAGADPDERRGA